MPLLALFTQFPYPSWGRSNWFKLVHVNVTTFYFPMFRFFYYLHIVNCTIWSIAVVYFCKSHLQSRVEKWAALICFSGLLDKYMYIYSKIFLSRKLVYCVSFAKYCNLWYPAGWWWCWCGCYLVVIPRPGYCSFIKTWIRESSRYIQPRSGNYSIYQ